MILAHITTVSSDDVLEIQMSSSHLHTPCTEEDNQPCIFGNDKRQEQHFPESNHGREFIAEEEKDIEVEDDNEHQPHSTGSSRKKMFHDYQDLHPIEDDAERIFNCIFSTIPYIGGKWLTKVARKRVSDNVLLEASHSFLDGGQWLLKFMDAEKSSTAGTFFNHLGLCFDEDTYVEQDYDYDNRFRDPTSIPTNEYEKSKASQSLNEKISSSTLLTNHRKRRLARSSGYGFDSLMGFTLLGCLVVGALIAYLIYLLT